MNNLKLILSILFLLAVSLPVALITTFSASVINENSKNTIQQRVISEVEHLERQINFIFEEVEARVNFLSESDIVLEHIGKLPRFNTTSDNSTDYVTQNDTTDPKLYRLFERIAKTMGDIAYVYMADSNKGYYQWPVGPLTDFYNPAIRPWFISAQRASGNIVRPQAYYWAAEDTVHLSTVKEIKVKDDIDGVIGVDITLTKMNAIIRNMDLGFNERLLLVESSDTILVDTLDKGNQFKLVSDVFTDNVFDQIERIPSIDAKLFKINKSKHWVSRFEFKKMGWAFYVFIPEETHSEQITQVNKYTLPLAVLCIIIFSLFGFLIARKITNVILDRENQLVKLKDDAEQAVVAKSQFLANMSHEIRTPLNGVIGMTQLLSTTNLSNEQQDKVKTILQSGKRLIHLINEVLDLSKAEANELELTPHVVQIEDVIGNISKSFQANASKKQLDLVLELQELAGIWVKVDDLRLGQVISNLLSNAIN